MITLRHVPVVKVLIPYALGSLTGYKGLMETDPLSLILLLFSVWVVSLIFYKLSGGTKRLFQWSFSISVQILFFFAGFGTGTIDKPIDPGLPSGDYLVLRGRVREEPVIRNGKLVFGVELSMACTNDSTYSLSTLLKAYMPKPSMIPTPEEGEIWVLCGSLLPIENAGNPGELDYASILRRKNCWYRFYCDTIVGVSRKVEESVGIIPGPGEIRRVLSDYWEGSPGTISLLKAVCLGDRSGLSEDLQQSYSLAGGMHVLAVSGLHVGLIWWVLNRVFSFIVLLGKREIYRAVLITLILWAFAYVTGFSSSVSRSVCMFTFYSLSRIMNHRGHSVNAILVSMFMLILIHPGRLLDVGFQLSYAAILSIVTLNPVFMGIWRPRNSLIRWCWEATGLSLAAQTGTLPLVIFYFHQVPVYALLTNLLAVPLLSCIITIFVVSVPIALTGVGTGLANSLLMMAGEAMNSLMKLIASFPGSVVMGLFTDRFSTMILMVILLMVILFLNSRERMPLYLSVFLICIMGLWLTGCRITLSQTAEARVSHFKGGSLLTIREGLVVDHYILSNDPGSVVHMDRYLSTAWGGGCFELSVVSLNERSPDRTALCGISCAVEIGQDIWLVGNCHIRGLVVAGTPSEEAIEILSELKTDFLVISGEPLLNGEDILPISLNLVVDGSNRSWYSGKLKETGLSFYNTAARGALVIQF